MVQRIPARVKRADFIEAKADRWKINRTIIVAGNYRCGTTWLAEMIVGGLDDYALAFEPIRAMLPSMHAAGIVQWRPYLTGRTVTKLQRITMRRVLDGTICQTDPLPRTDRRAVLAAKSIVVKFVRGLMSLRWLCNTHPIRHAFVIIRHPCAAVASQIRKEAMRGTPMVMSELATFAKHHPEIDLGSIVHPEQWLALWWAASYYTALSTRRPHPWTLVRYEDLCESASAIQQKVFEPLKEAPKNIDALRMNPSMTSGSWSTPGVAKKWRDVLSPEQEDRVLGVVARFDGAFTDLYEDLA